MLHGPKKDRALLAGLHEKPTESIRPSLSLPLANHAPQLTACSHEVTWIQLLQQRLHYVKRQPFRASRQSLHLAQVISAIADQRYSGPEDLISRMVSAPIRQAGPDKIPLRNHQKCCPSNLGLARAPDSSLSRNADVHPLPGLRVTETRRTSGVGASGVGTPRRRVCVELLVSHPARQSLSESTGPFQGTWFPSLLGLWENNKMTELVPANEPSSIPRLFR